MADGHIEDIAPNQVSGADGDVALGHAEAPVEFDGPTLFSDDESDDNSVVRDADDDLDSQPQHAANNDVDEDCAASVPVELCTSIHNFKVCHFVVLLQNMLT